MSNEEARGSQAKQYARKPYQVRLPGFITDEEIGLGDVIKRATSAAGIKPCGSCEQRAAVLNRWLTFSGHRPKHNASARQRRG